jgi:DNA excision repair protein ERCC-1
VIIFIIMDDDDYGADDALLEAMAAVDSGPSASGAVKQPTPQIINRPAPSSSNNKSSSSANPIVQPKPQIIQQKNLGSTILVSPRQRGNPVLTSIRSIPWEYSDIPADYVVGLTTCVLFLR